MVLVMNEEKHDDNYPSLLEKQMVEFWVHLAIAIIGLLSLIACFIIGIIIIFTNLATGIILVLIAFLLSPVITRSLVKFLQGRSAYKKVKGLKKEGEVTRLVELTQIRDVPPTREVQLRMIFSMFALVDLGAKEAVPILYDQYRSAKEHNYHPERYHEALNILAWKLGYESSDELLEKYKYPK